MGRSWTIALPSLSMTSSSVDTSTQAIPFVDIQDAVSITAVLNGATTAPGFQIQVNMTTLTTSAGGYFAPLSHISSGASLVYLTSALATRIENPGAMQARIGTSNVTSTSGTVIWSKQVSI